MEPGNAAALNLRGIMRADAGELEPAVADFTAALAVNAADYGAMFNRGLTHLRRTDLPAALADFSAAVELRPDDESIRLYRAGVADDLGDTATALADCDLALTRESGKCPRAYATRPDPPQARRRGRGIDRL